ncbi:MAG: ABC transporter permease subunit [Phormidium tanganyikae FI6-MK23]|jgi:arginine/lysine/histidine/glutamine transport system substrate-binding/permease protein|nr:ABC transporter permease subunit [Phormidium tanganyikae FI6-MK23]
MVKLNWRSIWLALFCTVLIVLNPVRVLSQSTLTVAVEPVYAPFEFRSQSGEVQGFDIDIIREIGKSAGFGVKLQSITFDGIIPALQAGTVDAAVGAITITPARSQVVSFSRPYFKAGLAIATRADTQNINALEDLSGKSIAVQIGTTGAQAAQKIPDAQIRTFDAAVLALQELSNGNVVAVVHDAPILQYALKTGGLKNLRVSNQLLTSEYYGIPTPKDSPNLARINQGLGTILNNGTYAQIYRKWFNVDPPELPEAAPITEQEARSSWLTVIQNALPALLAGALITIQLAAISVVIGLALGSLVGIVRLSKTPLLRWLARAYIDFFRGTPLLVQIFMIYFGIPAIIKELGLEFTFDRFVAAVVALSLNSAAYIAEIVRAGISSIEVGQTEAAESLGLDSRQTLRHIIFPQAFRRMLPPLGNEFITLLKDTSLVAVIGFEELFRRGQLIVAANYRPFELYAIVALIYLALTLLSSQGFSYLERRMNPTQQKRTVKKRDRALAQR